MQLRKPRTLRRGDRMGVVSTSSPVSAEELDRLVAYLGDRGYAVRVANGVLDRAGYLAGTAQGGERKASCACSATQRFRRSCRLPVVPAPATWWTLWIIS